MRASSDCPHATCCEGLCERFESKPVTIRSTLAHPPGAVPSAPERQLAPGVRSHRRHAPVAQWIEYWPPKPGVVGSNPARRANFVLFPFVVCCVWTDLAHVPWARLLTTAAESQESGHGRSRLLSGEATRAQSDCHGRIRSVIRRDRPPASAGLQPVEVVDERENTHLDEGLGIEADVVILRHGLDAVAPAPRSASRLCRALLAWRGHRSPS